jgi:hypothetical protein
MVHVDRISRTLKSEHPLTIIQVAPKTELVVGRSLEMFGPKFWKCIKSEVSRLGPWLGRRLGGSPGSRGGICLRTWGVCTDFQPLILLGYRLACVSLGSICLRGVGTPHDLIVIFVSWRLWSCTGLCSWHRGQFLSLMV